MNANDQGLAIFHNINLLKKSPLDLAAAMSAVERITKAKAAIEDLRHLCIGKLQAAKFEYDSNEYLIYACVQIAQLYYHEMEQCPICTRCFVKGIPHDHIIT